MSAVSEVEARPIPFPYPGLRPFRQEEAGIFFGRDEQVDQLLGRLETNRFLAVVGASGCGKSSLIRAGMIPALEVGYMSKAGHLWKVATMTPGHYPIKSLAKALLDGGVLHSDSASRKEDEAFLNATLRRGPMGLVEATQFGTVQQEYNLLLLVDQFEEIFRFEKDQDAGEARAFVDLLLKSAAAQDVSIYVVITMRSDFLGNCSVFRGLPEAMNDSQFLTPRLTREQNRLAIECPAALFDGEIEPDVVSRILNEMGTDPDQLPLMQHLLMRMWRKCNQRYREDELSGPVTMTLDDYRTAGGLKGALSHHVHATYENLGSEDRKSIAEKCFRQLTEMTDDSQMIRRSVKLSKMCAAAGVSESDVKAVVDEFRQEGRSFLLPSMSDEAELHGDSYVDISHESLIRQWSTLKAWTENESSSRRIAKALKSAAHRWNEEGRGQPEEIERNFVFSGVDLEESLEWAEAHPQQFSGDDWELEREFLKTSEFYRDQSVRQEEAVKHADELKQKNTLLAWLSALAVVSTIIAIGLAVVASWQKGDALSAKKAAEKAQKEAEKAQRKLVAQQLVKDGGKLHSQPQTTLLLAWEAMRIGTRSDETPIEGAFTFLREASRPFLHSGITSRFVGRHDTSITAFQVRDDRWLVTGSLDGTARLWDLTANSSSHNCRELYGHNCAVTKLSIDKTEDGGKHKWIASGDEEGTLRLWRFPQSDSAHTDWTGEPDHILLGHHSIITDLEFSKNGKWLVTADNTGRLFRWDLKAPSPTSKELVGDTSNTQQIDANRFHTGITDLLITQKGSHLITGSKDGFFRIWDLETSELKQSKKAHRGAINDVAIYPNGIPDCYWLATGGIDGDIRVHELKITNSERALTLSENRLILKPADPDKPTTRVRSYSEPVNAITFYSSEDQRWLVGGTRAGTIRRWNLTDHETATREQQPSIIKAFEQLQSINQREVLSLAVSGDRKWIVAGNDGNKVQLWRLTPKGSVKPPIMLQGHDSVGRSLYNRQTLKVAFLSEINNSDESPDSRWLVTAGADGLIRRWDLANENSAMINTQVSEFDLARFSPDGRWIVATSRPTPGREPRHVFISCQDSNNLHFYDPHSIPIPEAEAEKYGTRIRFEFSRDSQSLVMSFGNKLNIYHLPQVTADFAEAFRTPSHICKWTDPTYLSNLSINSDNRWLCATDETNHIALWNLGKTDNKNSTSESKTRLTPDMVLDGQSELIKRAELTDNRLICMDSEGQVYTWPLDANPIKDSLTYLTDEGTKVSVFEISPDQKRIAFGLHDGSIRIVAIDKYPTDAKTLNLTRHEDQVTSLTFSSDGRYLISQGNREADSNTGETESIIWDLHAKDPSKSPIALGGGAIQRALSSLYVYDQWIVGGEEDGTIWLWKMHDISHGHNASLQPANAYYGHSKRIHDIAIKDSYIYSVCQDCSVRRWEIKDKWKLKENDFASLEEELEHDMVTILGTQTPEVSISYLAIINPGEYKEALLDARIGKTDNAQEKIVKLLNVTFPDDTVKKYAEYVPYITQGRARAREGKMKEAYEIFEKMKTSGMDLPFDPAREVARLAYKPLLQKARGYVFDRKSKDAIETYDEILNAKYLEAVFNPVAEAQRIIFKLKNGTALRYGVNLDEMLNVADYLSPGIVTKKLRLDLLLRDAHALATNGQIDQAVDHYNRARSLDETLANKIKDPKEYALRLGASRLIRDYADELEIKKALVLYNEVQDFDPPADISAVTLNQLAWKGCLSGHADEVVEIADRAVSMEPNNARLRDTRAISRAFSRDHDVDALLSDFEAYIRISYLPSKSREMRKKWIERLKNGEAVESIFNEETLEALRQNETGSFQFYWNKLKTDNDRSDRSTGD